MNLNKTFSRRELLVSGARWLITGAIASVSYYLLKNKTDFHQSETCSSPDCHSCNEYAGCRLSVKKDKDKHQ